jgi:hypothetical protein
MCLYYFLIAIYFLIDYFVTTEGLLLPDSDDQNYECSLMHRPFANISVVEILFSPLRCIIARKFDFGERRHGCI